MSDRKTAQPDVEQTEEDDTETQPDGGPTMTQAGAMPSGSEMAHWNTANPRPDATKPETMPSSAKR